VLEAVDEDADVAVDREVERTEHASHALRAQPLLGAAEERGEHVGIVDRLERAEVAGRVVVALDAERVDLRGDPADRLAPAIGDEQLHLGVLEEGALRREIVPLLGAEWWHPGGIVGVDRVGQVEEIAQIASRPDRSDLDGCRRLALPSPDRLGDRSCHPRAVLHATSGIWHVPRTVKLKAKTRLPLRPDP
jgi:hypothetical protein